jgi:putative RecB family exonuclease
MTIPVPVNLSPSRVAAFTKCPLQFKLSTIDKIPVDPTPAQVRGSISHRTLEHLYALAPEDRHENALLSCHERAWVEFQDNDEFKGLLLTESEARKLHAETLRLALVALEMERPAEVNPIGLELRLSAEIVPGVELRGVIDRLDLEADGRIVVVDYKTGKAPGENYAQQSLEGVGFYAWLVCEVIGVIPAEVRLMYLGSRSTLSAAPSRQSVAFVQKRTAAIMAAIRTACERDDFRPRPSRLCSWCSFRSICPAHAG